MFKKIKIPTEMWSAIFEEVIDESTVHNAAIRSVDRAWRNMVDRTPRLWRRIVLDRSIHFNNLEHVRLYLLNSASTPLDVVVDLPDLVGLAERNAVAALLRRHVSRFRTLTIHAINQSYVNHFITSMACEEPAPLLEKVIVAVDHAGIILRNTSTFLHTLFPAPRLVDLTVPANRFLRRFDPPLATIRSLTLRALPFDSNMGIFEILGLLEAIPHLQHFTYKDEDNISYLLTGELNHSLRMVVPHLVSADVSVPGCGLGVFRAIDAPLLTSIRFNGVKYERWESRLAQAVISTLQHAAACSPLVKHIELRRIKLFERTDLYQWLLSGQEFPNLEVLRLDSVDIRDEHLRNSSGLGLGLTRLELHNCIVTGPALINFVRGRGSEFELVIQQCPSVTEDDLATLATIVTIAKGDTARVNQNDAPSGRPTQFSIT
jgi:hypothetical protein